MGFYSFILDRKIGEWVHFKNLAYTSEHNTKAGIAQIRLASAN